MNQVCSPFLPSREVLDLHKCLAQVMLRRSKETMALPHSDCQFQPRKQKRNVESGKVESPNNWLRLSMQGSCAGREKRLLPRHSPQTNQKFPQNTSNQAGQEVPLDAHQPTILAREPLTRRVPQSMNSS